MTTRWRALWQRNLALFGTGPGTLASSQEGQSLSLSENSVSSVRVFSAPGHVVLLRDFGRELLVFDAAPLQNQTRPAGENAELHFKVLDDPIINVLFPKEDAFSFLMVQRSGMVQWWEYSTSTCGWQLIGRADVTSGDAEVVTSVLHVTERVLYWCQRTEAGSPTSPCTVFAASLTQDDGGEGQLLGTRHAILTDCPACSLHQNADSILVWFKEPGPPGVYVTWQPARRHLSLYVMGHGVAASTRVYSQPASFHQMAQQTAAIWAESLSLSKWMVVDHCGCGAVCCVGPDGEVCGFSSYMLKDHRLHEWSQISDQRVMSVLHAAGLLTLVGNCLWLHSLQTGEVLQQISVSAPVCGTWVSVSGHDAGFVTTDGLLQVTSKGRTDLIDIGQDGSCLKMLESLTMKELRSANDSSSPFPLQSPALHLTALHQTRDSGDLTSRRKLEDSLENSMMLTTKLQASLEPLVSKFSELEELQWKQFPVPTPQHAFSVTDDVCQLLPPSDDLCDKDVYFRVTLLTLRSPHHMTRAVLARTGLEPQEGVSSDDGVWTYLRSTRGRRVLSAVSRLLFVTRPDILLKFLSLVLSSGTDDVTAFQTQTQAPLYQEILTNLPAHHTSTDPKMAVSVRAHIMFRSGGDGCEEKSLLLLIRSELWKEAARLLEQLPSKSDRFVSLYWMLLTSAAEAQSFPSISEILLRIAPSNLSIMSLLHQLNKATRHSPVTDACHLPAGQLVKYLQRNVNMAQ